RYLKQLVERFPAAPARLEGQARLGALLLEQNRDQEALAVYESLDGAATGNPRYKAEALYGRGLALLSLGRAGEAESLLKAVVDATSIETPEGLPARLGLARVYQEQGRTSDALRLYEMVAEESLDETGAESLYRLGTLLTEQGLFTVALEELGKMPVLFGAYPDWEARGYLAQGQIYEQLGEGGNADRVYDLVLERFPGTDFAEEAERRKASL
ncbi:MAG: tetratricopeptide repeat protein, partial [Bacteroidota bacterium]